MPRDILEIYADDEKLNGKKPDGSQIKVMVVDDSFALRRVLKRIFESTGYIVEEVEDGQVAVEDGKRAAHAIGQCLFGIEVMEI